MFDMLGSVLKNLVSRPATRKYPFEKREPLKDTRGQVGINIDDCIFCSICSRKCPSDAINVNKAEKSWEINHFKCVMCGVCAEVCPKKCVDMVEQYKTPAYSKSSAKYVQQPKPASQDNKTA
ncbi:MAG: 4Fe-4S dicluster domain-containing protein [Clostridia bacterium]|nr:4Fe-4S dicluster domain-containing protein [Clostridia bacterium]